MFGSRMAVLCVLALPAFAQSPPCEPGIEPSGSGPLAYKFRGDRCEGLYVQPVAGSPILVASWTRSLDFDPAADSALAVEWQAPAGSTVTLRARSLRRRLYYRMDAAPGASGRAFTWPTGILRELGLTRNELGLTAAAVQDGREILLPLALRGSRGTQPSSGYQLILMPGIELKEVFIAITTAEPGRPKQVKENAPLRYGYYPADRPVVVPVAPPPKTGYYVVRIGAVSADGGAATREFHFYHSAQTR